MRFEITTSRGTDGTGRLGAPALQPRRWTHVVVTLSGDTGTLSVDGEAVTTASITLDPLFKGRLNDFRI